MDVGGLARFDGVRFVPSAARDPGLLNTTITCLAKSADGILWAGAGNGLYRVAGAAVTHYGSKEGLTGRSVNCLLELSDGRLAVGTDGGGLALLRDGTFTVLTPKDGLASLMVYALYEDREGTLWIGTAQGLSILRKGKFATVTRRQGLFDDTAFVVLEDDRGFLWMSCNKGVYRARKADLLAVADGKIESLSCWSYGRSDGMGSSECNGGVQPSGWKLRDGRLCFATLKGVAIIDPSSIRLNNRPPPVVIEEVLLDGKILARKDGMHISPGRHRVEVHFSALSLVAPEKVRFKYTLDGFDLAWVDAGPKREAVYTGLRPGAYRFRVIACNNDGVWNETGAEWTFVQEPRFYETTAFLAACALLGILLLAGGGALRVRGLKRRQAVLERVVNERTLELARANETLNQRGFELEEANVKLERLSKEDGLTGVANRRHFEEVLEIEWRRATRTRTPLSLLMIDIDEFKPYNDTLGHQRGDACLKGVADALGGVLHRAGDLLARYGGDEFVAILPTVDRTSAVGLAESIRKAVEDLGMAHPAGDGARVVTVSVGVGTAHPPGGAGADALVADADRALYLAKEQGRNRVCAS